MDTVKQKINFAFRELRKAGYFAKQNFWCCQSCGWYAVPENAKKVVFYHNQDLDRFKRTGELMLAWGGNGSEICRIFEHAGLVAEWDGTDDKRIAIREKIPEDVKHD
jgi:hypothetical protein